MLCCHSERVWSRGHWNNSTKCKVCNTCLGFLKDHFQLRKQNNTRNKHDDHQQPTANSQQPTTNNQQQPQPTFWHFCETNPIHVVNTPLARSNKKSYGECPVQMWLAKRMEAQGITCFQCWMFNKVVFGWMFGCCFLVCVYVYVMLWNVLWWNVLYCIVMYCNVCMYVCMFVRLIVCLFVKWNQLETWCDMSEMWFMDV